MALVLATGSNLGNRRSHLQKARDHLATRWPLIAESRIWQSAAVDYVDQPEFYNQVLQFALPWQEPQAVMATILAIEAKLGRVRTISRGPRTIDIDIIFWGMSTICAPGLNVPHPHWSERSFVVRPLSEIPFFHAIKKCHTIPTSFTIEAISADP